MPLKGKEWKGIYVLELFHGPTLSFKDFGARTMARLIGHYKNHSDERLTILVATSGDTGSAVADGFSGQERVQVVLLYPKGKGQSNPRASTCCGEKRCADACY